jgi:hypothetical protein
MGSFFIHIYNKMAKAKGQSVATFQGKPKKRRPGVHAKSKTSKIKSSKNYVKISVSQGK